MLPRIYRLPAGETLKNATSFSTEYFRVLVKPNSMGYNRFGFVVGKKIDKRAVVRNRLKRVLREVVRAFVLSGSGHDVLFLVKQPFTKVPTKDIAVLVEEVLKKTL